MGANIMINNETTNLKKKFDKITKKFCYYSPPTPLYE